MSKIEEKLEKMEAAQNGKDGKAQLLWDSPEAKEIFKQMSESEFIRILDNVKVGKPNI